MNIGKEIEIRQVPERRIAVPTWPKTKPEVRPEQRPIEVPNWPVKVPEKVGIDVRL